jgi:hypothetical protein
MVPPTARPHPSRMAHPRLSSEDVAAGASTPDTCHATGSPPFLTRANWEAGVARHEAQLTGQGSPRRLCWVRCSALLDLLKWREFRSVRIEINVSWFITLSRFIVNGREGFINARLYFF